MQKQIQEVCGSIKPIDEYWISAAQAKQLTLTKPPGSLGVLEEVGNRLASILETIAFGPLSKRIYVVAADHGVSREGVSAYPSEVTAQMVHNFIRGGAAINVLARHCGIELKIVDAGVTFDFPEESDLIREKIVRGTSDIIDGPALTRDQAEQSILVGIKLSKKAKEDGIKLLGIGDMGIGNTTSASAITAVLTGLPIATVTGRGTGVDDTRLAHKIEVIERAIEVNRPNQSDPTDVLSKVGGAEIGVMAGIVLGASAERIPIMSDGFIATAAAALAIALSPIVRDYLFLAHQSQEPGHVALINHLNLKPLLSLDMRLGEGTGAALAMHIVEAAAKILSEMATFDSAGITNMQP